ncbi:hypothetical protein [Micromonospora inyonensis]|nr:hypothetical protein [Micromonospora inyonensis]
MEARRQHREGALKDLKLRQVELRHSRGSRSTLLLELTNEGSQPYDYDIANDHQAPSARLATRGTIKSGESREITIHRIFPDIRIEGLFNGECPCDEPHSARWHWRTTYEVNPEREATSAE